MNDNRNIVDAAELASILGIPKDAVLRLGRQGRIPRLKVGWRTVRFDVDAVLAVLSEDGSPPLAPSPRRRAGRQQQPVHDLATYTWPEGTS